MCPIAPIPDVPEPPRLPRSAGLGRLAENSLVRFFAQTFNRAKDGIAELIRNSLERLLESLEKPLVGMVGPVLDDVLDMPGLPDSVRNALSQTRAAESQAAVVGLIGAIAAVVMMLIPAALSGVSAKVKQISFYVTRPNLLDFNTLHSAKLRDAKYTELFTDNLAGQGWTDEQMAAAQIVAAGWPDIGALFSLWRREDITDAQFEHQLVAGGMAPGAVPMWKKLKTLIPGPADLVRFALREAWRDDVAAKYGYDQGMVSEFTEWMEKQGYSAEWARAYWRSHWVVPGASSGFEMQHRGIISEEELVDLLKVNDFAPAWIPKLMQMVRPLPGRIDRRWAYEQGEITQDELFDLYKADGYDDFWANVLTNTVAKKAVDEAKGLTRSAIEKAYKKRRLSYNDAISMLDDVGIPENVASFYLSQVDADRADDLLDLKATAIEKQYLSGLLIEGQVRDRLVELGVDSSEIDADLEVWNITRQSRTKRPSRTNLDKFFRSGVIDINSYRGQMERLGYSDMYVDWYLASLAIERQEATEKEERAARTEQERVEKAKRKTDYQRAKAVFDVDIAELTSAIASAQVALVAAQNQRDLELSQALPASAIATLNREYQPLLFDAEAAISEAKLQIATLQTEIKVASEEMSTIDRSLIENVDMTKYAELKASRLEAQTEQARIGELIAADRVAIAQTKEAIAAFTDPADIDYAKETILALQTEIAQYSEQQAHWATQIREIDETLAETLSVARKAELHSQKAQLVVENAARTAQIAQLNEAIRGAQAEREELERELDTETSALPGREDQVKIKMTYQVRIAEIESNIMGYREDVARLRLKKSSLAAGERS